MTKKEQHPTPRTKKLVITAKFDGEKECIDLLSEDLPADLTLKEIRSIFQSEAAKEDYATIRGGCCKGPVTKYTSNGIIAVMSHAK